MQKLSECLEMLTNSDTSNVFVFSPCLGDFDLEYISNSNNACSYRLAIPFETNKKELYINEDNLKRIAVLLGIGKKYFELVLQKKDGEALAVSIVKEMLSEFENDLFFLTEGSNNIIIDIAVESDPVTAKELLSAVRNWYKSGTNDSDENNHKEWTEDELNNELYVYYYSYINGIYTIGFGLKYKRYGGWMKFNRLGSIKTTIMPCVFKFIDNVFIPIVFDINGITECKPAFSKKVDIATNISTILGEAEDFLFENKEKFEFKKQRSIDPEQYLKHLSHETAIPKKYIKKGVINGLSIRDIVSSICFECKNVLTETAQSLNIEDTEKKLSLFEKLCKSAGYAMFYQDSFCNCCYKTIEVNEE